VPFSFPPGFLLGNAKENGAVQTIKFQIFGAVQKVLKVILTPQHKVLIRVNDTICCGVKNPKQAFWTAPYE